MIVRQATGVSFPVLFPSGHPDAGLSWRLFNGDVVVGSGTVTVPDGAISTIISVPAELNTLPIGSVLGYRDIEWTYTVGGLIFNGNERYAIEARLPYGVSKDGVRTKLGTDKQDLPDDDINLAKAYLGFRSTITAPVMDAVDLADSANLLALTDAIEATAALALFPTMAVRVANKETNGTNAFQRQTVDWNAVAEGLREIVADSTLVLVPTFDIAANDGPLLIVVNQTRDPVTGI